MSLKKVLPTMNPAVPATSLLSARFINILTGAANWK